MSTERPSKTFLQIMFMCLGFFGIQFGWALQMGNMSAIYSRLGASEDQIPMLWLAAPVTGLLVQPLVGYFSDRTWCRLGRRRPYFLGGAIFSMFALFLMPQASAIWMAVIALWILDTSVNVSMEPFRAFVGDILPEGQRKTGYAMQSVMIGAGAVIASFLPQILTACGVSTEAPLGHIPNTVKYSFYIGAVVLIVAILATIKTTPEYPPADMEEFNNLKKQAFNPFKTVREMFRAFITMPATMRRLAVVQFFTWAAFMVMWVYFTPGIASGVFHAAPGTAAYETAANWGSSCFGIYNGVAFVFAFALLWLTTKFSAKAIHIVCLTVGGLGLGSLGLTLLGVQFTQMGLIFPMVCIGIAWSSILSMPYAMLSNALPADKMGFYMGVFNFFIVIPQICVNLFFGPFMKHVLGGSAIAAVGVGGLFLFIAAVFTLRVHDRQTQE
ncbi:MFS transporter [Candidatus Avelusimicrobium stercoris]|uniref:MFS transporter n=1 Tax=Candidatus Avelusimicrobium stercoris TaxID=1947924 RepID=UPI000ED167E3|nr:MFS transporter [Elusimicrobiota bacterium]